MSDGSLVAQFRKAPPLQVSYPELVRVLQPITFGYAWGEGTIRDLWLLGAPLPHAPEKRIVFPGQLAKWLEDVLERKGQPLDVAAKAYNGLQKLSV